MTDKYGYTTQLVENTKVLCKDDKMVIPKSLQKRAVAWYHHYLQPPGSMRLKETLCLSMYWKGLQKTDQSHVKKCQLSGEQMLKSQIWKAAGKTCHHHPLGSVMCGPHRTIHPQRQRQDSNWLMCITMIDPAPSWFEIAELPHSLVHLKFPWVQRGTRAMTNISIKNNGTLTNCQQQSVHWSTGAGLVDAHVLSI